MMKEYWPADYMRLKQYIAAGRWFPAGSSMEEGDVNSPSAESIFRQILYGNRYFQREFGKTSAEYMLPDCFGFPASLPSILAHAGLKGFSTQKLTWNSAARVGGRGSIEETPRGIPFNVGYWVGPDGRGIVAALNPEQHIWGFDSFDGLPEPWTRTDITAPQGTFRVNVEGWMPPVLHNVTLVKGMFHETLPQFKKQVLKSIPIAFLHVDCDIYASTKEIFDQLAENVVSGTIIVFDEFYNYPEAELHEFRAFQEFLERTGKRPVYLAYNQYFEQAVVQIA